MVLQSESKAFNQVLEFHKAFGHPVGEEPAAIPMNVALKRTVWAGEELIEFLHATANGSDEDFGNLLHLFYEGLQNAIEKSKNAEPPEDVLTAQMDALTDASYFINGSFVVAGVDPQPLFDIVQEANMAKLGPDGKPIIRESDRKIMKPEGWQPPEPKLAAEIQRQIFEAR